MKYTVVCKLSDLSNTDLYYTNNKKNLIVTPLIVTLGVILGLIKENNFNDKSLIK
jgi:hypothetical protein